jgi:hypothetical protein
MDFKAFADELAKIAKDKYGGALAKLYGKALEKAPIPTVGATIAAPVAGYMGGKQAIQDWRMGRAYRKQMERRR